MLLMASNTCAGVATTGITSHRKHKCAEFAGHDQIQRMMMIMLHIVIQQRGIYCLLISPALIDG